MVSRGAVIDFLKALAGHSHCSDHTIFLQYHGPLLRLSFLTGVFKSTMALRASATPPMSPSFSRKRKSFARRCERACCSVISYFPLAFVYGLTTWAVWVQTDIGFMQRKDMWTGQSYQSNTAGRNKLMPFRRPMDCNTSHRTLRTP